MIISKITQGEGTDRSQGVGNVSPSMVTRRAQELAIMDGRKPEEFTDADWEQARQELMSRDGFFNEEPEEEFLAAVTPTGEVPSSSGHHTPKRGIENEDEFAEELVKEGIEEAVHDEMIEGGWKTLEDEDLVGEDTMSNWESIDDDFEENSEA